MTWLFSQVYKIILALVFEIFCKLGVELSWCLKPWTTLQAWVSSTIII